MHLSCIERSCRCFRVCLVRRNESAARTRRSRRLPTRARAARQRHGLRSHSPFAPSSLDHHPVEPSLSLRPQPPPLVDSLLPRLTSSCPISPRPSRSASSLGRPPSSSRRRRMTPSVPARAPAAPCSRRRPRSRAASRVGLINYIAERVGDKNGEAGEASSKEPGGRRGARRSARRSRGTLSGSELSAARALLSHADSLIRRLFQSVRNVED